MNEMLSAQPLLQSDGAVLVVLAAGAVTQDFVSVVNSTTPAMLPYMGRPLIYQIIVNHIRRNGRDIIVALPENELRLEEFLQVTFGSRVNLILTRIAKGDNSTPVTSLLAALNSAAQQGVNEKPAFIVYGDIYFEPPERLRTDRAVIFVDEYIESDKYSFVSEAADGSHQYFDPQVLVGPAAQLPNSQHLRTDIGAYWIPSIDAVRRGAMRNYAIATVGGLLSGMYPDQLDIEKVALWSDLGHLDTATQIRTRLIGAREFNSLSIDESRGLITKRSSKPDKILQELNYYSHLPADLAIYFPRLHDFQVGREISYTLEYYSYRTLAEYLVFFSLPTSIWQKILDRLLTIHGEFRKHQGTDTSAAEFQGFYLGKLMARMGDIVPGTPIHDLVEQDKVSINGSLYRGWRHYSSRIEEMIVRMSSDVSTCIIHGDLCFSNILYDPQTGLMKLIDPRGEFFSEGCYGDPRYDLSKLLHSFHGGYDFIMQEMYELRQQGPSAYHFRLFRPEATGKIGDHLVAWLSAHVDYDIKDLLLLEALLFLSMLPLHADDPERQQALYLTGIKILQEVFDADLH